MTNTLVSHLACAVLCWSVPAFAQTITGWRGDGSGAYPQATPPLAWDGASKTNVLWATKVGKSPNSSPIVIAGKVFLTADPDVLVCVDAESGKVLWRRSHGPADVPGMPADRKAKGTAGNTVPTPVSDGKNVWVAFGTGVVACYDLAGNRTWIEYFDLEPAQQYGRAASPVLVGGKLILCMKYVFAVDPQTGKVLWKAEKAAENYGTPAIAKVGGVDLVVTPCGDVLRLSDGQVLATEIGQTVHASPLIVGDVAYFIDASISATRLSAKGGGIEAKKLWEDDLEGEYFASPVYLDGLLYTARNEGKYYVIDAKTGKTLLEQELEIPSCSGKPGMPTAHIYPSLCLVGGKIMLGNDAGDMLILEPGREFKPIRRNQLGAGSGGTPAFAGGRMYIRGDDTLYCIGK